MYSPSIYLVDLAIISLFRPR